MKIYFLRHAPTAPNLTGAMVQDYSQEPIAGTLPEHFEEDIRPHLPELDINTPVICSPAKRCVQTVEKIFGIPGVGGIYLTAIGTKASQRLREQSGLQDLTRSHLPPMRSSRSQTT